MCCFKVSKKPVMSIQVLLSTMIMMTVNVSTTPFYSLKDKVSLSLHFIAKEEGSFHTLVHLVDQRLSYMKDVAAYKWVNKLPIEDVQREEIVLAKSMSAAGLFGLDSLSTRSFFETQISLAKTIQQFWFDQWTREGFVTYDYADLKTEIRPSLIELGDDILKTIAELQPWQFSRGEKRQAKRLLMKEILVKGQKKRDRLPLYDAIFKIQP